MENSAALETWVRQAACGLSRDSAARVRMEILEHYESARESARAAGADAGEADRAAVASLGSARMANRQYREVLLTVSEARLLGSARWESRAVCARPWLKRLIPVPVAGLLAGVWFGVTGETYLARLLLVGMSGLALLFAAFLPIYTPARGRVFRYARWAWLAAVLVLASGPSVENSWMLPVLGWPMIWIEWMQSALRRKLPVAQWPKQLYL
jgi:hypothetical protein